MDKSELEKIRSILKYTSSFSSLELPALLVAALALIPGIFDEALVVIGAIAIFSAIALGRNHIIKNRDKYMEVLTSAHSTKQITDEQFNESVKALNTLTIEGGN
ncbi:MAG: hypothetical protein AB2689_00555 [Candidatus Thiodiazotropha taylori]